MRQNQTINKTLKGGRRIAKMSTIPFARKERSKHSMKNKAKSLFLHGIDVHQRCKEEYHRLSSENPKTNQRHR